MEAANTLLAGELFALKWSISSYLNFTSMNKSLNCEVPLIEKTVVLSVGKDVELLKPLIL